MYRSWQGEVDVIDENTGEIIGKKHMCVEADDNVPFGCELGGPRPWQFMTFREKIAYIGEDWPIILLLLLIPVIMVFIIIMGIIRLVNGF